LNRRIPKRIEPEPLAVRRKERCSHISFSASNRRRRQLCELSHVQLPVRHVRNHLSVRRDRFELTSKPREALIVRKHDRKSCNGTGRYKLQLPGGNGGKSSHDGRSHHFRAATTFEKDSCGEVAGDVAAVETKGVFPAISSSVRKSPTACHRRFGFF